MAFPPHFLDEIRARIGIAERIGRAVRLTRHGHEHKGLCPFHQEKTPSFTVSADKGFFHCFGCGAHGDVIGFVMRQEGMTFPEAVERLAAEAGLDMPRETPEERERAERAGSLYDVLEAAARWFEGQLRSQAGREALTYLRRRGIEDAALEAFRLGFAPDGRAGLKAHLGKHGFAEEMLVEAGLIRMPDDGRLPYDYFRSRVMFPITDARGRVIAFGGRVLGEGEPKYLNSPNSALFHKGRSLYGLAQARSAIRTAGKVVVAEGYMDVIAFHKAGIGHAVAPLGTALTEEQLGALWRLADEPTICLDGDQAGVRAASRAAERALPAVEPGKSLGFAFLPPGEDPDSLVAGGRTGVLVKALEAARPLIDFIWDLEVARSPADTPERRAGLRRRLMTLAEQVADRTVRGEYRRLLDERYYRAFARRPERGWGKAQSGRAMGARGLGGMLSAKSLGDGVQQDLSRLERGLVATIVTHPELLDEFDEEFGRMRFRDPALDSLKTDIITIWSESPGIEIERFKRHLASAGHDGMIAAFFARNDWSHPRVLESFAQPGAATADARGGWRHLADLYYRAVDVSETRDRGVDAGAGPDRDVSDEMAERLLAGVGPWLSHDERAR